MSIIANSDESQGLRLYLWFRRAECQTTSLFFAVMVPHLLQLIAYERQLSILARR